MDRKELEKLIYQCFIIMMHQNLLNLEDQTQLFKALKSIVFYLLTVYNCTQDDVDFAMRYFWQEYNKGCTPPMTQDYIDNTIIPAVYSYPNIDITIGGDILFMAFDSMD